MCIRDRYDSTNTTAKTYLQKIRSQRKKVTAQELHEWYLRGVDAYAKDDFKGAIYWWKKILQVDPTNVKAREGIKRAEANLKKLEKLRKALLNLPELEGR